MAYQYTLDEMCDVHRKFLSNMLSIKEHDLYETSIPTTEKLKLFQQVGSVIINQYINKVNK